jgi:hypothetical protein
MVSETLAHMIEYTSHMEDLPPPHSGGMWRIQWQIRAPIRHRIRLCRMTYGLKPVVLAFFVYTSFYLPLISA